MTIRLRTVIGMIILACAGMMMALPGISCGDEQSTTGDTSGASSVPPRKTDVIVFIRGGEVWAINPKNNAQRQVTKDGQIKAWPRISPDGRQIIYEVLAGDGSRSAGIYRVPLADGAGTAERLDDSGAFPAWSTDGASIALVKQNQTPGEQGGDEIAVISAENPAGSERVLTDHQSVVDSGGPLAIQNLGYAPDGGKYIYFMRGRRSDSRWLARVEVATGAEDNLTAPAGPMPQSLADGSFSLFNVSQMEGRKALVSRGDLTGGNYQQNHQLFIRFLEPVREDSVIESSPDSVNPSLKPDNTRFVYEKDGTLYIHTLAGGGDIERLTDGAMPDWGASSVGPGFGDDNGDALTGATTETAKTSTGDNNGGAAACGAEDIPGRELIDNGAFDSGMSDWQTVDIRKRGSNSVTPAGDPVCGGILTTVRSSSQNDGGLIGVEQSLNADLAGVSSLRLRLMAAIDSQSLTSDGWYGGETPVFVTINYVTGAGQEQTWTRGMMVSGSVINYPDRDQDIPANQWYRLDIPDLRRQMPDAVRITKVTVGGSGWDFRSRIGLVSLKSS